MSAEQPTEGGAPGSNGGRAKVLLVGWDGVRFDVLHAMNPPTVRALAQRGFLAETRMPDTSVAKTATAPGWATILTGVWPGKHKVVSNLHEDSALHRYPDVLTRLKRLDASRHTFAAVDAVMLAAKKGPGPLLGPGVDVLAFHDRVATPGGFAACDPRVLADARSHLATADPDLAFVYFGGTDDIGHAQGGSSAEYRESIMLQDARLQVLLDAVSSRPTYRDEDWLVVVTTDHGHTDEGGHGGDSWQERQSFVLAAGSGVTAWASVRSVNNVDIVPTVLAHLGMPADRDGDLDGRPFNRD